jgi:hypothetical protein
MEDFVRRVSWFAIPVLAGLAWGCGDSTGVTGADLVGTWNATAFEFSDFGDPVMDFDVIGMGGSVEIVINGNGAFTVTVTLPQIPPEVTSGTWVLQGDDLLIFTETGETDGMEMMVGLSGTTLTVHSADLVFDFGSGEIPAQLNATFVKQ